MKKAASYEQAMEREEVRLRGICNEVNVAFTASAIRAAILDGRLITVRGLGVQRFLSLCRIAGLKSSIARIQTTWNKV